MTPDYIAVLECHVILIKFIWFTVVKEFAHCKLLR